MTKIDSRRPSHLPARPFIAVRAVHGIIVTRISAHRVLLCRTAFVRPPIAGQLVLVVPKLARKRQRIGDVLSESRRRVALGALRCSSFFCWWEAPKRFPASSTCRPACCASPVATVIRQVTDRETDYGRLRATKHTAL